MTIAQLGTCKVTIEHKNNRKRCHFFVVPGDDQALMDMPPPNNKRELQVFLGIINYFGKFSPGMAVVCDPLQKLTSSSLTWT